MDQKQRDANDGAWVTFFFLAHSFCAHKKLLWCFGVLLRPVTRVALPSAHTVLSPVSVVPGKPGPRLPVQLCVSTSREGRLRLAGRPQFTRAAVGLRRRRQMVTKARFTLRKLRTIVW